MGWPRSSIELPVLFMDRLLPSDVGTLSGALLRGGEISVHSMIRKSRRIEDREVRGGKRDEEGKMDRVRIASGTKYIACARG